MRSREALVNAAKHAQVESVSLYAEVETDAVTAYVKDRGVGFDIEAWATIARACEARSSGESNAMAER